MKCRCLHDTWPLRRVLSSACFPASLAHVCSRGEHAKIKPNHWVAPCGRRYSPSNTNSCEHQLTITVCLACIPQPHRRTSPRDIWEIYVEHATPSMAQMTISGPSLFPPDTACIPSLNSPRYAPADRADQTAILLPLIRQRAPPADPFSPGKGLWYMSAHPSRAIDLTGG